MDEILKKMDEIQVSVDNIYDKVKMLVKENLELREKVKRFENNLL